MKLVINQCVILLCLLACTSLQASEAIVDWMTIKEARLLPADSVDSQSDKLVTVGSGLIKPRQEMLINWHGHDYLTIELQRNQLDYQRNKTIGSSVDSSNQSLTLYVSKGDGLFMQVQAATLPENKPNVIRWMIRNPSKNYSHVLLVNTQTNNLEIKLYKGKKRQPFDWLQYAKIFQSKNLPSVSISSKLSTNDDYNFLSQDQLVETLTGPARYRFEVIYPWKQEYAGSELSQINLRVGDAELDSRFIKIQPARYNKKLVNGVASVLSRKQHVDLWVPKGQNQVTFTGDRPLYLRWLVASHNQQLFLNEVEKNSKVSDLLALRNSRGYLEQRDSEKLLSRQIGYRSIFPEQPVSTIESLMPSVNVSQLHSNQYFMTEEFSTKLLPSPLRHGVDAKRADSAIVYSEPDKTQLVKQQAISTLTYKNPNNLSMHPIRLKLKVNHNRQVFQLATSADEVIQLIYDPRLTSGVGFFPTYQRLPAGFVNDRNDNHLPNLVELIRTLEINFLNPWNEIKLTNLSQNPLIHQLSYAFIKRVESSETDFYYQLKQLLATTSSSNALDNLLFERLATPTIKNTGDSQVLLNRTFQLELQGWASRLDKRVGDYSKKYKVEEKKISEERSKKAFAKVVNAVAELGVVLSTSQANNYDEVFSIFTQSLLKSGNYSLLKKTLYFFTQSQNDSLQQASETHLLKVLIHLQDWSEFESYWALRLKSYDRRGFAGIASSWLKQGRSKQAGRLFLLDSLLSRQFYDEGLVALAASQQSQLFKFTLLHFNFLNRANNSTDSQFKAFYCRRNIDGKQGSSNTDANNLDTSTSCRLNLNSSVSYFESFYTAPLTRNRINLLYNETLDLYFKSIALTESDSIAQSVTGPALIKVSFFQFAKKQSKPTNQKIVFTLGDKSASYDILEKNQLSNIVVASSQDQPLLVNQTFLLSIPAGEKLLRMEVQGAAGEVTLSKLVEYSGIQTQQNKFDLVALKSRVQLNSTSDPKFNQKSSTTFALVEKGDGVLANDSVNWFEYDSQKLAHERLPSKGYFEQYSDKALSLNTIVKRHITQFETSQTRLNSYFSNAQSSLEQASEMSLFNRIRQFREQPIMEQHLALANDLKHYLITASPSIELMASIKQFLQEFEWRAIESVVSSAGSINVEQKRVQGRSQYSRLKYALLLSNINQYELPIYQQSQRVIQYYSQIGFTATLSVRALTTLGAADTQVMLNTSINGESSESIFKTSSEMVKTIKIKPGLNTIKLNIKQSNNQLFYASLLRKTANGQSESLLKAASFRYYVASNSEPLKIYMPTSGWIRVEALVGNNLRVYEQYIEDKGVVRFDSINQQITKYRVSQLVKADRQTANVNRQNIYSAIEPSIKNTNNQIAPWSSEGESILVRYDNISLDALDFGTHTLSLGYRSNKVLEDEPLVQNGNEQQLEYRFRQYLPKLSSYLSNRMRYKQADQFKTLSNRFHFDYLNNKNFNLEFDLNAFYQLQSENNELEGAFRLATDARANWNYFWNNQWRNKLSSRIELGYLSDIDSFDFNLSSVDTDVYSDYKRDHLNKLIISDRVNFRPYFDTQFSFEANLSSNDISEDFSLDNYDLSIGLRQFWDQFRLEVKFRHKSYFSDSYRDDSFKSNRFRLKLDYDLWNNRSNLWQLSLAYQYELQQSESEVQLWFSWSPTNKQYLHDFSPIDEPFLKLRKQFVGEQRINNLVVKGSHE